MHLIIALDIRGTMHVAELWRYPVKSLRGEQVAGTEVGENGIWRDREIVVVSAARRRVITSRTHHRLLGLQGSISPTGEVTINGIPWDDPAAKALVEEAVSEPVELVRVTSTERFDVLPLLVATDGAVAAMGVDRRRFRPNILVGGVGGLAERGWEGKNLGIGGIEIHAAQLRARCVMTTYDPDTLEQDKNVLFRIVKEFDGTLALDCSVVKPGIVRVGDPVTLIE